MKNTDVAGVLIIAGLLLWFTVGKMGESSKQQEAFDRGKQEQYVKQLESQNMYLQGQADGLKYPRN